MLILSALYGNTASALSNFDFQFYSDNDILYYLPESVIGEVCSPTTPSQQSGELSTSNTAAFLTRWHDTAVQIEILYGIPWEGAMAQGALESGWGSSNYAKNKNAYFGVNAVDSNPDLGYSYATPELSWYGQVDPASYAEFIRDNPRYKNHGAFNHVTDPIAYVTAIKAAGYATDPDYVSKLTRIINNIIRPFSQSQGWQDSKGVEDEHPEAAENALKNAAGANVGADETSASLPPCGSGSSVTDGLPFSIAEAPNARTTSCYKVFDNAHVDHPHGGIDIAIPSGTTLYATMDGAVKHVGRSNGNPDGYGNGGGFGYYITIDYGGGTVAYYGHMQDGSAAVSVGQRVVKGQEIGKSGNTGNSTGPHLHYEVRVNGNKVNPMNYMGDISSINSGKCVADE
jgi:murein DD-endopeptidase MepM/ murein hydrolase activator NlpD